MQETGIITAAMVILKYMLLFLIPFVEPQLAGVLGGIAYLIVRHELHMASLSTWSITIVVFFGWLGAWATINILAEHCAGCPNVWQQIISATAGFLSYDAMMALGANTTSVIGFFTILLKGIIEKGVNKWNS